MSLYIECSIILLHNLIPWDRLEKHQLDFPLLNTLEYIRRP